MELEFEREHLYNYETVLDTTLCQEETLEAIVPDACPDIQRIIDCCGQVCLTGKQAQERLAVANGLIRAAVLYQPEEGGLRKLDLSLPFSCKAECGAMTEAAELVASPRLRRIEARALNPRKVLLRVDLAVDITVCQPRERTVCTGALEAEEIGLCELCTPRETYLLTAVQERPFTFSEIVRIPGSGDGQLLSCRGTAVCGENRLIGGKLIFKGSVNLRMLFLNGNGELLSYQEALPFSQVMEVTDVGEDSAAELDIELTDLSWQTVEEDGRSLEVTSELLAQAMIWVKHPLTLLQDLYSTQWTTQVQMEDLPVVHLLDRSLRTQSIRELLETAAPARNAVDCWLSLGEVNQQQEGEWMTATVPLQLTVLYLDDQEQLQSVQRMTEAVCKVECPPGAQCRIQCTWNGEMFIALSTGGVEARFSLDFHCRVLELQTVAAVAQAQTGEERHHSGSEQPSVVLRLAAPGERLWDIAKSYGTTRKEIRLANGLESDEAPEHTMLLIPKVR